MKYLLKTEQNQNGNLVFSKERVGKQFFYLAKAETGEVAPVTKEWILANKENIVNLGVSKTTIYPVEVKDTQKTSTKPTETQNKIDDFGKKIGGAKKDLRKEALSLDTFETMTDREKEQYVRKDNIWPKPNYKKYIGNNAAQVEDGVDRYGLWYVNQVRTAIPSKPLLNEYSVQSVQSKLGCSKEEAIEFMYSSYVAYVSEIRDVCKEIKTFRDIDKLRLSWFVDNGYTTQGRHSLGLNAKGQSCIDNKILRVVQMDNSTLASEIKDFLLTEEEALLNKFRIVEILDVSKTLGDGYALKYEYGEYFLTPNYILVDTLLKEPNKNYILEFNRSIRGGECCFESRMEAIEYAKCLIKQYPTPEQIENYWRIPKVKGFTMQEPNYYVSKEAETKSSNTEGKRKTQLKPNVLTEINRTGKTYRSGDIEGKKYIETLKIRGGEFGNWENDKDRQSNLNYAYDSFCDLAMVLGIPQTAVSIDGHLSIAFGARGSGNAMAHYEPAREVINLTKLSGAGNLAHEYFHFIDDMYGKKQGYRDREMIIKCATENEFDSKNPFSALVSAMKKRVMQRDEKIQKNTKYLEEQKQLFIKNVKTFVPDSDLTPDEQKERDLLIEKYTQMALEGTRFREEVIKRKTLTYTFSPLLKELFIFIAQHSKRYDIAHRQNRNYIAAPLDFICSAKDIYQGIEDEQKENTKFLSDANFFNAYASKAGHNYWNSNKEMAARAFACYVKDKLEEKGCQNDYLCGQAEFAPVNGHYTYPCGEERKAINQAFDKLFEQLRAEGFFK